MNTTLMNSVNWHVRWPLVICMGAFMAFMTFGVLLSTGCAQRNSQPSDSSDAPNGSPDAPLGSPDDPDVDCPTGMARLANASKKTTDTCMPDTDGDGTPDVTCLTGTIRLAGTSINTMDTCVPDDDGDGIPDSIDVDADGDGLIEIENAEMLDNMRYDLAGTSYETSAAQTADSSRGCPDSGCKGYELTANINLSSLLNANNNGMIDTTTVSVAGKTHTVIAIGTGKDKSWVPIGTVGTGNSFTGTFEGNNHTIANLWVNISSSVSANSAIYAGLFGVTGNGMSIRNVGVISGSIHASSSSSFTSYSGGLVGYSNSTVSITNSYFSGTGGVSSSSSSSSSSSYSGGFVGSYKGTVSITNSYFSGTDGVSASSRSGGLVGSYRGTTGTGTVSITNSYFSGMGRVSSSSSSFTSSSSGGFVGSYEGTVSITNSYFSGMGGVSASSSSFSRSGGFVGSSSRTGIVSITNSYFSGTDGVSSSGSSISDSGGFVGVSSGTVSITNSYFSGMGGVSSSAASSSRSGGFVGVSSGTVNITNSYFSGMGRVSASVASNSYSGGLVGFSSSSGGMLNIMNSYWNIDAPQSVNGSLRSPQSSKREVGSSSANRMGSGLTLIQLKAFTGTSPSGLLLPTPGIGDAWDLGTASELPAVKLCVSPIMVSNTGVVTCASYGALLAGQ